LVKGGYGTVRIIDLLILPNLNKSPKWIVGFSDITVLHNHLNTMGYKTIHGIMPVTYPRATTEAVESKNWLCFGNPIRYEITTDVMNSLEKLLC
jgi:muramoyltetrapeptide carboxypeptidase